MVSGGSASAASKPQAPPANDYNSKLNEIFPVSNNDTDPNNRAAREAMLTMRDCGYDNYEKNLPIILEAVQKGKINDLNLIQLSLEKIYFSQQQNQNVPQNLAGGGPQPAGNAAAAAANNNDNKFG